MNRAHPRTLSPDSESTSQQEEEISGTPFLFLFVFFRSSPNIVQMFCVLSSDEAEKTKSKTRSFCFSDVSCSRGGFCNLKRFFFLSFHFPSLPTRLRKRETSASCQVCRRGSISPLLFRSPCLVEKMRLLLSSFFSFSLATQRKEDFRVIFSSRLGFRSVRS